MKTIPRAFTLIEIMVVIVIISILAALSLGIGRYALVKGQTSRAHAEIAAMENALEGFKNDNGYYPLGDGGDNSSTNIYNNVAVGSKIYMTFQVNQLKPVTIAGNTFTNIADPFGKTYYYLSPGASNSVSFDLWSNGPDKLPNTVDDITNWKQQ